jgi:hypothetical protein
VVRIQGYLFPSNSKEILKLRKHEKPEVGRILRYNKEAVVSSGIYPANGGGRIPSRPCGNNPFFVFAIVGEDHC